jgi:hypothetical protein
MKTNCIMNKYYQLDHFDSSGFNIQAYNEELIHNSDLTK